MSEEIYMERGSTSPNDGQTYGDGPEEKDELWGDIETPQDMKKVAKAALKLWESQDKKLAPLIAQWKVNAARRMGISNAKVIYDQDEGWIGWLPKNASPDVTPDINKAAQLCRRFTSQMFVDPPIAEVEPGDAEGEDVADSEFTQKALLHLQGEDELNSVEKARDAWDRANTFGSAFEWFFVDKRGGGRIPLEVEAHPVAVLMGLPVSEALKDPTTGIESGPYQKAYVREDGTLTHKRSEAATKWAPRLKSEIVDGRHVRLFPHTVSDIRGADGAQKASFITWGDLKKISPDVEEKIPEDERKKFFSYRPDKADDLMPIGESADDDNDQDDDSRLVFVLTTVFKQCPKYEKGIYLITAGESYVIERAEWVFTSEEKEEPLPIPATQYGQFKEGREHPYKVAAMELTGGANELRAAQIANLLDWLEKFNNDPILLPHSSMISPAQIRNPRGSVLYFNPGGKPERINRGTYPRESLEMYSIAGQEADNNLGLQSTAEGLNDSSVQSGRHAYAIIGQVHAGLAEPRQNIINGFILGSRVALQLARAFLTTPQKMRWDSDDGSFRYETWKGSDLSGSSNVRLKTGSMTLLSTAAKAQFVEHLYAEMKLIPAEDAQDMLRSNIGGTVGWRDDERYLRIRAQIAEWAKGPPEGWQPPQPVMQTVLVPTQTIVGVVNQPTQQPVIDPATGQPQMQPDPVAMRIWEPVPSDVLPPIAQIRLHELGKFMQTKKYLKHPAPWRAAIDAEFMRMQGVIQQVQMAQAAAKNPPPAPTAKKPAPGPEGVPQDSVETGSAEVAA